MTFSLKIWFLWVYIFALVNSFWAKKKNKLWEFEYRGEGIFCSSFSFPLALETKGGSIDLVTFKLTCYYSKQKKWRQKQEGQT